MEFLTTVSFSLRNLHESISNVELRYLVAQEIKALAKRLEQDKDTQFSWEVYSTTEEDDPWNT